MRVAEPTYWNLLWELTYGDFKLRDQGTVLGFLWTLLYPILMFTVLYLLFTKWMGSLVENYAAYLIIGFVQYQFFSMSTNTALPSLKNKINLVKNFKFPREIIVFSAVGCIFWSYIMEMAVLLLFLILLGVRPGPNWLLLPFLMVFFLFFNLGVSLVLALLAVVFEDLGRIWSILTAAGFYLTPIFYPLSILSESRQEFLMLNPLTHIVVAFRRCLSNSDSLDPGGLIVIALLSLTVIVASLLVFYRHDAWIADKVIEP